MATNNYEVTMERALAIKDAVQHFEWFLEDLNRIDGLTVSKISIATKSDNSLLDMRTYLHEQLSNVMEEHGIGATTTTTN